MAQHFLLSSAAKTLSLASIFTMKDAEAETAFRRIRWADTDGEPVCPHCGGTDAYDCRRLKGAPRFRCRACGKDFTITSGTLFASHKLPLRCYLAAIAIFCNEVKGKSALALSPRFERLLQVRFRVAAQTARSDGRGIEGPRGRRRRQDRGSRWRLFGGYVKPANHRENRRDRRLARNQNGKRKVVVVVRERGGNSVPAVFRVGSQGDGFPSCAASPRAPSSTPTKPVHGKNLHKRYEVRRSTMKRLIALDGACTNWAEEFFSRMRRAEIGHHHHIAGAYLLRYAQEASWREDNRRIVEWRSGRAALLVWR